MDRRLVPRLVGARDRVWSVFHTAADPAERAGDRPVVLTGRPGELVLWLFGRRDAAAVELTGDPEAIERALSADLGI